jgi:hypothetical protein
MFETWDLILYLGFGIWNLGFGACYLDDVGGAVKMAQGIG